MRPASPRRPVQCPLGCGHRACAHADPTPRGSGRVPATRGRLLDPLGCRRDRPSISLRDTPRAPMSATQLVLIGDAAPSHVGAHFFRAAGSLGLTVELVDVNEAFGGPALLSRANWWLRGHRPARLGRFGRRVAAVCRERRPAWLLTTGVAPLSRKVLAEVGSLGIRRFNFSTDDPWNRAHRAPWFIDSLCEYDRVFSPRRHNLEDFRRSGCRSADYLPFAYAPEVHFVESPSPEEAGRLACEHTVRGWRGSGPGSVDQGAHQARLHRCPLWWVLGP